MTSLKMRTLLALAALSPAALASGAKVMTWTVDGVKRQAIVYAPSKQTAKAPLVFSFHGHGDDMENFQGVGLQDAWPEAIVVYPQGLPTSRSAEPALPGWQTERGKYGDRDLKLVDAMLASLRAQYQVDDSRIYATGFSNGAMFTYLLWAERPGVFAAFAPVAARLPASVSPTVPRPLLHVAGRNDETIPFRYQVQAIAVARRVDGVSDHGKVCGVNCTVYDSANGTPVMTVFHGGGHEYPEGTSQLIVKFFKQHPLHPVNVTARAH
jgi:polyhydroxybutyrate depolymerase